MNKSIIYNSLLILFITIFFASCANTHQNSINLNKQIDNDKKINECKPEIKEVIKEIIKETPPKIIIKEKCIYPKTVIGQNEYVYLPSIEKSFKARIDTGATTTSIHALNIKEFERDGEKWVNFNLIDNEKKKINQQLPISRVIYVKRHGTKNQKRYVVKMRINLADSSQAIDVSLTNRANFKFPVLIGRNFLNGVAIVDVSKKYTSKPLKKSIK